MEGSVVRRIVLSSGRVVRGQVVAVVRAVVVSVSRGVLVVRSGVVPNVVGSTAVVVAIAVVVVGRRVVVGAFTSFRRMFLFTSLNQPGTSMRQQYTLSSPVLVLRMVMDTSPLQIIPRSAYLDDFLESTFVPSVWRSSSLHLELGHSPLPQHMLLLPGVHDEYVQGKVTG